MRVCGKMSWVSPAEHISHTSKPLSFKFYQFSISYNYSRHELVIMWFIINKITSDKHNYALGPPARNQAEL